MTGPMYRRIADDLRGQLESGLIPPGTRLPTELELRDRYGAARNTIREAIRLLTHQGLVETMPGRGTFAVQRLEPFVTTLSAGPLPAAPELGLSGGEGESAFAEIRSRGRTPYASAPKVSVQLAPDHVAARLRVPPGTQVVSRYQERYIDDMPWSLQASYYPFEFVTMGATDLVRAESLPVGAASYLEQRLGLVQVGYRERVLVRQPAKDEARFFGLPDDGRISVDSGAVPDELATPAVA